MKLYAPSTIRELQARHGFRQSKGLGQNFLADQHMIARIMELSLITKEDFVIEIGPGMGALTGSAARRAKKVAAIELDNRLIPVLEETLEEYSNVQIIRGDILKTDLKKLIEENGDPAGVKIIGNLPYYITTPILMKLLEDGVPADSITIMVQKEVAQRMKAGPGSKAYGALSVAVQYYCRVGPLVPAPKEVFVPVPKVDSAVLRLDLRKEKPAGLLDEGMFFACVKAGFGQRRKTLANSLTGVKGLSKEAIRSILQEAGIDPGRRAETLSIEEFSKIANQITAGKAGTAGEESGKREELL